MVRMFGFRVWGLGFGIVLKVLEVRVQGLEVEAESKVSRINKSRGLSGDVFFQSKPQTPNPKLQTSGAHTQRFLNPPMTPLFCPCATRAMYG